MELKEDSVEPFPTTDETAQSDANTPEPIVKEKTDTEASDFDDTSAATDMSRTEAKVVKPGVRGQGTNQATPSKHGVKSASESWHTTASGAKTPSPAAGSKAKNATTKDKASIEGKKVGTSSGMPLQRQHSNDETISMISTLKNQSSSGPSSATGSKSKIPRRSTSDADMKPPVTPDKTSVTDASGSVVTSKQQKQPKTKESLKSPTIMTKAGRKPSFEETKGGKSLSGDISPTKIAHKTGIKHFKEKSDEDKGSISLVNGSEKDREERTIKPGHPIDKESLDVKKHLEKNSPLASTSGLPVSSHVRKRSNEKTEPSGISNKKITSSQMESDRPATVQVQSSEQQEVTPGDRPGSETPPPLSESPKKGKKFINMSCARQKIRYYHYYLNCHYNKFSRPIC